MKLLKDKWVGKFYNKFKDSVSGRKKIMEDLRALDDIKEIVSVASSISKAAKDLGLSIQDLTSSQLQSALSSTDSNLFEDGLDAYNSMPENIKGVMLEYADAHYKYKPQKEDIHSLAISGGGGKGQFYVGAIKALEDGGVLNQINHISGASAGALTAIPLALGCDADELMSIVKNTDFRSFMIESRGYNSQSKRSKKWREQAFSDSGYKILKEDDSVANIVNDIKVQADTFSLYNPEYKNALDKDGNMIRFAGIELDEPLNVSGGLNNDNFNFYIEEIWKSKNIKNAFEYQMGMFNKRAGFDFFKSAKEILIMSMSFTVKSDYIEHYFGVLSEKKLSDFCLAGGKQTLINTLPRMQSKSKWKELTILELGKLAETQEGKSFGFKNLTIGITKTKSKGGEFKPIALMNQLFKTEGFLVSSDTTHTQSRSLSLTPINILARMSMSIPYEFNQKTYNDSVFVDGGLHNNLPTELFDAPDFNKGVLSIIPFVGGEIRSANTVQEGFNSTPSFFRPDNGWHLSSIFKTIMHQAKEKGLAIALTKLTFPTNAAYQEMGIRESFRNIIINTEDYKTMSFRARNNDLTRLNNESFEAVSPNANNNSVDIFDNNYNSVIRLFEHKIHEHKRDNQNLFISAMQRYTDIKSNSIASKPFQSSLAYRSMNNFINKTKSLTNPDNLTECDNLPII